MKSNLSQNCHRGLRTIGGALALCLGGTLVLAGVFLSCAEVGSPPPLRLWPEAAQRTISQEDAWRSVFRWELAAEWKAGPWQVEGSAGDPSTTPRGIKLVSENEDLMIWREERIDAGTVDVVRAHLARAPGGPPWGPRLYWRHAGGRFSETQAVTEGMPSVELPDGSVFFDFPVGHHTGWQGMIDALRLDPVSTPGVEVEVLSLEGIAIGLEIPMEPVEIALGPDLRTARLVGPGDPVEAELKVPEAASLRFSFGLWEVERLRKTSMELLVSVAPVQGDSLMGAVAAVEPSQIFTATFPPQVLRNGTMRGWISVAGRRDGFDCASSFFPRAEVQRVVPPPWPRRWCSRGRRFVVGPISSSFRWTTFGPTICLSTATGR